MADLNAIRINSRTYIGYCPQLLLVDHNETPTNFNKHEWDAIYRAEAFQIALFLRNTFCAKTLDYVKEELT